MINQGKSSLKKLLNYVQYFKIMGYITQKYQTLKAQRDFLLPMLMNGQVSVNASLTLMYWHVGFKINEDILKNSRAEYGKEIVHSVSAQLTQEFGRGYSKRNIADMIKFSQIFNDIKILQTLSAKLSWSHFKEIIYMDDALEIEFYSQMSSIDNWSVRVLRNRIDSMLYERTALSKKPDELITYELDKLGEGVVTKLKYQEKK